MELESVQLETSWNEAARVINENSQRITTEIAKLNLSGGGESGGATTIGELLDVDIYSVERGDILIHDGDMWINTKSSVFLQNYYTKEETGNSFVNIDGDQMGGPLVIAGSEYQLRLTGQQDESGDYKAAIIAESIGELYGGVSWTREKTNIDGASLQLTYNDAPIPTVASMEEYVDETTYTKTAIDEKFNNISFEASSGRIIRVFEKNGNICLASSEEISSSTYIALARKLTQGWSAKQGWSVSRSFSSIEDMGSGNGTFLHHTLTLQEWVTPNVQQPNGMYYYHLMLDGQIMTPDVLLEPFISSLHEQMSIYWGKRKKQVAFGLDTEGHIKRAATLRFGVAIGEKNSQIAPFKLVVQSKCYDGNTLDVVYLDETTWRRCVQFRV